MTLKSLLFGSAAILAAGTGAQAADLPTAEPVEYVRICDAFGTGFYYIPGTDTCLKVGGQVRAEAHYVFDGDDDDDIRGDDDDDDDDISFFFNGDGGNGTDDVNFNNFTTRARGNVRLDARTQTDFGLIRAFIDLELTVGPSNFAQNYDGTGPSLAAAFVQITNDFGTFTAGHTGSFFDFFGTYGFETRVNIDDNTTEQTLFAYTFGGGNGFSFTVSAEDPASSGRRLGNGFLDGDDDLAGQEAPDGVFNIRVDQGWGSAQVMGVVGQLHSEGDGGGDLEDGDSELGFAVGVGVSTKIPFLGGLEASAQGGYSEGRLGYISNDDGGFGDFIGDDPGDTTEAWNARAGIRASFSETVDASVNGSFTHVEGDEADGADIDVEYEEYAVTANLRWKPVEGLFMGPEIGYKHIEFSGDNGDLDDISDDGDFADIRDGDEDDIFGVMFRLQRSF